MYRGRFAGGGVGGKRGQRGHRQPEIGAEADVDGAAMSGRSDADDRDRDAFDPDDASNDGRVGAERLPPRLMTEDGDKRSTDPLFASIEPAAERRLKSQDVEI